MTRKHSISLRVAKAMRIASVFVAALLLSSLTTTVSSSEGSSMWDDARLGVNGGTVAVLRQMGVHLDLEKRRPTPFPEAMASRASEMIGT